MQPASAPLTRSDVTALIRAAKIQRGIPWATVAERLAASPTWATAACLGQMAMSEPQARAAAELFGLPAEAVPILQAVPMKGALPTAVPADPLLYRLYEIVGVFGTTIKELIHEEFGDGIMSAIDFSLEIARQPDPKGDRVRMVMSGKFLPYPKQ